MGTSLCKITALALISTVGAGVWAQTPLTPPPEEGPEAPVVSEGVPEDVAEFNGLLSLYPRLNDEIRSCLDRLAAGEGSRGLSPPEREEKAKKIRSLTTQVIRAQGRYSVKLIYDMERFYLASLPGSSPEQKPFFRIGCEAIADLLFEMCLKPAGEAEQVPTVPAPDQASRRRICGLLMTMICASSENPSFTQRSITYLLAATCSYCNKEDMQEALGELVKDEEMMKSEARLIQLTIERIEGHSEERHSED